MEKGPFLSGFYPKSDLKIPGDDKNFSKFLIISSS